MTTLTDYLWFNTPQRQEFVRITDEVAAIVARSGVQEGLVLVVRRPAAQTGGGESDGCGVSHSNDSPRLHV